MWCPHVGATNITEIVRRREFSANIYSLTLPLCRQFWSYSRRHHLMSAWLSVDLLQVHTRIHTLTHKQTGSAHIFTTMSVFCRSSSIYRTAYWYVSDATIVKPAPGTVDVCHRHRASWFYQHVAARTENDSERSGDMIWCDPLALLMKLIQLNSYIQLPIGCFIFFHAVSHV